MQPQEYYEQLKSDRNRPTSSQSAVIDFKEAHQRVAERSAKEIIMLTVRSAMSGAQHLALTAVKLADIPVQMVDISGSIIRLGRQAKEAARAAGRPERAAHSRAAQRRT